MRIIKNHKYLFITILFLLLSFFVFGINCFHPNVWFDEAYQMVLNRYDLKSIISYVIDDTSPPLYAGLLHIATAIFGNSIIVGRLLSLLLFDIQIILAFYPIRRLFGEKAAYIYSILILTSFYSFFCSIEVRLYSMSMTATVGAIVYALLYLRDTNKKDLILYTIFCIIGCYSHNYATISIIFLLILTCFISLIKKKGRKINISNLITLICFSPWIKIMLAQEKNINTSFWIVKPSLQTILQIAQHILSNNNVILVIMLMLLFLSFLLSDNKKDNIKKYCFLLIPSIGLLIVFYIYSLYRTPLLVAKYAVPVCGIIYLLIAKILSDSKKNILPFLFIILTIPSFISYYQNERKATDDNSMKEMINFINNTTKSNKHIFINSDESSIGISEYYFPNSVHYISKSYTFVIREPEMFGEILYYDDIENIKKENEIIMMSSSTTDIFFKYNGEILKKYKLKKHKSFPSKYNEGFSIYILEKK